MAGKEEAGKATVKVYHKHGTKEEEESPNMDAWQEQVERAWSAREKVGSPSRGAAEAYVNFLDSMFFYYGENARAVERATSQG